MDLPPIRYDLKDSLQMILLNKKNILRDFVAAFHILVISRRRRLRLTRTESLLAKAPKTQGPNLNTKCLNVVENLWRQDFLIFVNTYS